MEPESEADAFARKYPWRGRILRALVVIPVAPVLWVALMFNALALYDRVWGFEHDSVLPETPTAVVVGALTLTGRVT